MYEIENLTVAYDAAPVLENISLRIREGEKAVIIGPSGAGKSTLLKKLYEMRQERCAFIHQDYALVPQLTAFLNVYAGRLDRTATLSNLLNLVRPQPHALDEILRIVAPGGGVCFSINERAFDSCGFRDRVEELHEQDAARCLSLTREPYHVNEGIEGWVCVLQKTAII